MPTLIITGPVAAVAGLTYLGYKRYNHPGEKEKRRISAEHMELTRKKVHNDCKEH